MDAYDRSLSAYDADEVVLREGDAALREFLKIRLQLEGKGSRPLMELLPSSQVHIYQLHWLSWRNNRRILINRPLWGHKLDQVSLHLPSTVNRLKSIINKIEVILQEKEPNCVSGDKQVLRHPIYSEMGTQFYSETNGQLTVLTAEQLDGFVDAIEAIGGTKFFTEIENQMYELEFNLARLPFFEPWTEEFMVPNHKARLEYISQRNLYNYLIICYPKLFDQPLLTEHLMATILQRRRKIFATLEPYDPALVAVVALFAPDHWPEARPFTESRPPPTALCPFCGKKPPNRAPVAEWRSHVLKHTAPYSCRFQQCETNDQWTVASLAYHDSEEHSRVDWGDVTKDGPVIRLECSFCDFTDNPRFFEGDCALRHSEFYKHLGQHFTSLVLATLPVLHHWPVPSDNGTELKSDSSDDSSETSDSDAGSSVGASAPSVQTVATSISDTSSHIQGFGSHIPGLGVHIDIPGSSMTTSSGREPVVIRPGLAHRPRHSTDEVVEEHEEPQRQHSSGRPLIKAFCKYFIPQAPTFDIVRQLLNLPKNI